MELCEKDSGVFHPPEGRPPGHSAAPQGQQSEPDLPPEFCHYRDEGCELAQSCLHCPYPGCVEDRYDGRRDQLRALRDREIVRRFSTGKKTIEEIARTFRVSTRTVRRALGKVKHE